MILVGCTTVTAIGSIWAADCTLVSPVAVSVSSMSEDLVMRL
jgi:hypothetical protein